MRLLAFVLAMCLFLAGCVSGPMYRTERFWQKDGVSYEDARTVEAQCRYDVNMQQFSNPAEKDETIRACMMMQGFRVGTYKFQVY